jgi:hypothetical protein
MKRISSGRGQTTVKQRGRKYPARGEREAEKDRERIVVVKIITGTG